MAEDDDVDALRQFIDREERKLRQLRAIHEDIAAGRLPDQDQVVNLSVMHDFPDASAEVKQAVKAERLDRVAYGKLLAEFHAACLFFGHAGERYHHDTRRRLRERFWQVPMVGRWTHCPAYPAKS